MRKLVLIWVAILAFEVTGTAQSAQAELGKTEISQLESNHNWYSKGFKKYKPDKKVISSLKDQLVPYKFIVFGGTWCPDTRNLLPKFYKTLNEAGITSKKTDLYLLDFYKSSPEGIEEQFNVTSVPTFIITKNGQEIGRIEGHVDSSIEKDLLELVE